MSKKSLKTTKKIPRPYRKALSEKKFKSLTAKASDHTESDKIKTAFPRGDDGKYQYKEPVGKKGANELRALLKKIHKEKTGPRTIRIIFLVILIAVPLIVNILFLDGLAAKYMEKGLEDLTGTDVDVEGLDIVLFSGRISLESLNFASASNPMKNDVVFDGLLAELDLSTLFFRRVVFNALEGNLALSTDRDKAAMYPDNSREGKNTRGNNSVSVDGLSPLLDIVGDTVIPDESLKLARQLNGEASGIYESWSENLSGDFAEAENLSQEVEEFLAEPLPENSDVTGWLAKVKEGRRLAGEIESKKRTIENYRRDLARDVSAAEDALQQARAAVEQDLVKIDSALSLDDELINGWIQAAIHVYAGPRLAELYARIIALGDRTSTEKARKPEGRRRMDRGRIVAFPVILPPRFSIRKLALSGDGVSIRGEKVGVDHDLVGAPTRLEVNLVGLNGLEGLIDAELVIDGRSSAENLVDAVIAARAWPWVLESEDLGGMAAIDGTFTLTERENGTLSSGGSVALSNWAGNVKAGQLSFINEDSPPLGFTYTFTSTAGRPELKINLDRNSIRSWGSMIADSAISSGKESARKALLEKVDADLSGLEETIDGWDGVKAIVDNLASSLAEDELELEEKINEWTKKSAGTLPVPEASNLIEGLGSLF